MNDSRPLFINKNIQKQYHYETLGLYDGGHMQPLHHH